MSPSLDAPGQAESPPPGRRADGWVLALVVVAALASAAFLYVQFLQVHRSLWDSGVHDRNSHYLFSLRLATDVRNGRVLNLLEDFNQGSGVWTPLQGLLSAGCLLVGGLDYRLAVLPSLLGYVLAIVFGFLTARRAVPAAGNLAGLVAALFLLASPAYRAFATDIMLESLGAGLSLTVLYCYLVAVQARPDHAGAGRWLGLALTALFLQKYNYWLLVVFAMAAAQLTADPRGCWAFARTAVGRVDWRRWLRAQLLHPLTYLLVVPLLAVAAVYINGDRPLAVAGHTFSLYPPYMIITIAYAIFFVRLVLWWRRAGRAWVAGLDGRVRHVVLWHLWPAAVWFLLPKHFGLFLWYLGPATRDESQHSDLVAGVADYARWMSADYHLAWWSAVAAVLLFLVALLAWRRLRPGGHVVLCFVLIAAALTVAHPNRKARLAHSWLAGGWAAAGVGLAMLGQAVPAKGARFRPWLLGAAAAGLAAVHLPGILQTGHAMEGGPHADKASMLEVSDCWLPELDQSRRAAVLTAAPVKPLVLWRVLERYGRLDRLENDWYGFGAPGEENRRGFLGWLQTTRCDTLVYIDQTPGLPPDALTECVLHSSCATCCRGSTSSAWSKARTSRNRAAGSRCGRGRARPCRRKSHSIGPIGPMGPIGPIRLLRRPSHYGAPSSR